MPLRVAASLARNKSNARHSAGARSGSCGARWSLCREAGTTSADSAPTQTGHTPSSPNAVPECHGSPGNCSRRVLPELAFPDYEYPKTKRTQSPGVLPISISVVIKFCLPEPRICLRCRRLAGRAAMPKTAMYKHGKPRPPKYQVGTPGQRSHVLPIPPHVGCP